MSAPPKEKLRRLRHRFIPHDLRCRSVQLFVLLARYEVDQLFDQVVALDAFGFGVEVGDDAVTQHGGSDLADVFGADVIATLQQRAGLAGEDQVLAGAGAGAPADVIVDEGRAAAFGAAAVNCRTDSGKVDPVSDSGPS